MVNVASHSRQYSYRGTKSLSEKGSDPLRRGEKADENHSLPKGQTPFRIGSKSADADDVIRRAIEVFVHGYSFGRSLTHPHVPAQVGGLWVLRDAERANSKDYRKEEWIALDEQPANVDRIARQHTRGRFFICAFRRQTRNNEDENNEDELRIAYKQLGYRLLATEPLFIHSLQRIPRIAAARPAFVPAAIHQVDSVELVERFAKASRSRPMTLEHLGPNAPFRQYLAMHDEQIVGWVRSVRVGTSAWVANMQVEQQHRRCGIGSAMLERLLRDDRKFGIRQSVLLASHSGALLYPKLGYKQIGMMFIYAPRPA